MTEIIKQKMFFHFLLWENSFKTALILPLANNLCWTDGGEINYKRLHICMTLRRNINERYFMYTFFFTKEMQNRKQNKAEFTVSSFMDLDRIYVHGSFCAARILPWSTAYFIHCILMIQNGPWFLLSISHLFVWPASSKT